MWLKVNNNPLSLQTEDCAIRAVSLALDVSWEEAYTMLAANGFLMALLPNADATWSAVLREHGFKRAFPDCQDCITVREFTDEYNDGIYVIKTNDHVVTAIDGRYMDSWDSGDEYVIYFWYKED